MFNKNNNVPRGIISSLVYGDIDRLAITKITKNDLSIGPGSRIGIYLLEGHDSNSDSQVKATSVTPDQLVERLGLLYHDHDGVTILGGESMHNIYPLLETFKKAKGIFEDLNVMVYTKYRIEELITMPIYRKFLSFIDILVDGEYDYLETPPISKYTQSKNQRVVNVRRTLEVGSIMEIK